MNAWTIGSGTLALILAGAGVYLQVPNRTASATTAHYSITTPDDAASVGLCVPVIEGTGDAPRDGSVWLVIHGVSDVGYYLVRQVELRSDGEGWTVSKVQVGSSETANEQRYQLVLWRLDEELTDAIGHIPKDHRVFDATPTGASEVSHPLTVKRRADSRHCE
ncbi:hypothetical protein [Streptomyces sp. NBC_01462]|uniref:hypothetical protein n=1 Tax=Streptomyces sp. NBC_01462 TaxID=2903876 RepID=UPI002E30AB2D|nr:hypothetical protein [Streptomyces sp. NBC_01462]